MTALLRGRGLGHRYGSFTALHALDLEVRGGEVLAIVGENGAGKSTLLKILGGLMVPTTGTLEQRTSEDAWKAFQLRSARHAIQQGIALVHQEVCLAEELDVAGAMLLGRERHSWGLLDHRAMRTEATGWLAEVGLAIDPSTRCGDLSIAQRQQVEIAKALSVQARILILDEPTSCLSAHETERLLDIIRQLRSRGVGVILVSHHLDEVLRVADRALVLRDGRLVGELRDETLTRAQMESLMVGREIKPAARAAAPAADAGRGTVLEVCNLQPSGAKHRERSVSLRAEGGHIVALAGLVGAGRTELLEAIAGIRAARGQVVLNGKPLTGSTQERVRRGVAFVPEDRARHGTFSGLSASTNVTVASLQRCAGVGVVDRESERTTAAAAAEKVGLPPEMLDRPANALSGGNQQKAVVARWVAAEPSAWLLDEPTRGVDVASRAQIHEVIRAAAHGGAIVLMASSDMEEILHVADRVLVMHDGRIAGELTGVNITEQAILALATGGGAPAQERAA